MDLTPYAGRWVALIADQVVGVGFTAEEAQQMARHSRSKETAVLRYVDVPDDQPLALSPLLDKLRPLLSQQTKPVYLVGGAVRDALLGRVTNDLDFAVPENAIELGFRVADALGLPAYVLDRERDAARVMVAELDTMLDFTRLRGHDLQADLRDRDFTINALALPATAQTQGAIIDLVGGLEDLAARRIRLTHADALAQDPVRALRAVRLAHGLVFELEPATATAVTAAAPLLHNVSVERVRDELLKLLKTPTPAAAVTDLARLGILVEVLPELAALQDVAQSPPHHEDALRHSIHTLDRLTAVKQAFRRNLSGADENVRAIAAALASVRGQLVAHLARTVDGRVNGWSLLQWAALLHDTGKALTATVEAGGQIRFFEHDRVGAELAKERLRVLALSNAAVDHVTAVIANHMRPLLLAQAQGSQPTRRAIYRFYRASGAAGLDVCLLALADHLATYDGPGPAESWQTLLALVSTLLQAYFQQFEVTIRPVPLLDGKTLMTVLGMGEGPAVGRILRAIEEAQAAGEIATRDEALTLARSLL